MEGLEEIRSLLQSKKTFVEGTKKLHAVAESLQETAFSGPESIEQFHTVIKRAFTVLQARYTAKEFWQAGLELFLSYQFLLESPTALPKGVSASDKAVSSKLGEAKQWVETAMYHLEDEAAAVRERMRQENSERTEARRAGGRGVYDSLGTEAAGPPQGGPSQMRQLQALLEGGGGIVPPNLMGLIDPSVLVDAAESGPPPASRDARYALPVKTVTAEGEDGDRPTCAVCLEEFKKGGKAKEMPCGHLFHFDCILSWLEKHNTCPSCRKALPSEKIHFDDVEDTVRARDPAQSGLYA
uniref:RING-type E3 ubiquitin transferase n=1 Tax=Chromera velia CCMP2878 TaxID=1169474 RepID=A0A0G4FUJ5_9ALVE|mmetsp:Transcript_29571/g.58003  ORF Transcript_29571/g.58003 Transcript_29571/m.58003 type:complete len:297 (+) Transcript_29571:257-1147(+)|eukprot:Cvel_18769.t1-p1 / transcript=Cvel_18769.t1 / gene=Cvel_18769 / organism=Chromera_velia_CCMP2878 / gene_product=E3 ubiquitin-protein ligase AIP2, putative / transcript_product=E3 ubiquitin-protein ligase AIP2, putative / location=Cvel_scaffold1575:7721-11023(-) / protein_length=296 / sequence_SO=supercontig / SO=protein_coding / is_pseudo=false